MANQTRQILIESILGGQGKITNFSRPDEFRACLGIDPSMTNSPNQDLSQPAAGLITPSYYNIIGTGYERNFSGTPLWVKNASKTTSTFVYDSNGSTYTISNDVFNTKTNLSDGGSMTSATGNGAEYYDNYMYFAKNTDIARFGPLNGDAVFNGTYWTGTLGKAALTNSTYPNFAGLVQTALLPNHVMHRHSDGKLYFADVVGNQGTIHVISTTKTTVEGDTDNGSTANKLTFGHGLYPTAIESYGTDLVVALYENIQGNLVNRSMPAKLAFWDTTSDNFNSIIFSEFPDSIITGLKNINGTLYIISASSTSDGFRVSRYIGGNSIEEVRYFEQGAVPAPGAIDGNANRLVFGSYTQFPNGSPGVRSGCVYSIGLQNGALGQGMFVTGLTSTVAVNGGSTNNTVTALCLTQTSLASQKQSPVIAWVSGDGKGYFEVPGYFSNTYSSPPTWQSQIFKIGQPFKITKIRIPLTTVIDSDTSIVPKLYFDDNSKSVTLPTINSTNFGTNTQMVVIRPVDTSGGAKTGDHNFFFELKFTDTAGSYTAVSLPITIEYELLDVDTAYP